MVTDRWAGRMAAVALAGVVCAALGCGEAVGNGGGSGGTADAPSGSRAFAMFESDFPPGQPLWGGGAAYIGEGGAPPAFEPNPLVVLIGSAHVSCDDPYASPPCGGHWIVALPVPGSMQHPGIYSVGDLAAGYARTGPLGPECWLEGGGFFTQGQLEIISIDDTQVVGALTNTGANPVDADGDFVAPRCP